MERFKEYSYEQTVFLPIHFAKQVLPRTFEYTLNNLLDKELDLGIFEKYTRKKLQKIRQVAILALEKPEEKNH